MARHEQLTVGELIIESSIKDENGSTIVQDSATQSIVGSNDTSRAVSAGTSYDTAISSGVAAGSVVSLAVSIADSEHSSATTTGKFANSLIGSTALEDITTQLAYNTSVSNTAVSVATAAASLSSVTTNANAITSAGESIATVAASLSSVASIVTNSTTGSTGLNWDETLSELGSDITATSTASQSGSAAKQNNPVFGTVWFEVMSLIESASQ